MLITKTVTKKNQQKKDQIKEGSIKTKLMLVEGVVHQDLKARVV